jgi:uncharacterized membrane protein
MLFVNGKATMASDTAEPAAGPAPGENQATAAPAPRVPAAAAMADDVLADAAVTGAAVADDAVADKAPPLVPAKPRKLLYLTLPGCWGALVFACLSFTPSLLPRGGLIQGVLTGIATAIGYGLGVLAASIWRAFAGRGPRRD